MGAALIRCTDVPVTSPYGFRILNGKPNFHEGTDTGLGWEYPHSAYATGIVTESPQIFKHWKYGWWIKYGIDGLPDIEISHHSLKRRSPFKKGQRVHLGDIIGNAGASALSAKWPHIHTGFWINGQHHDLMKFLVPGKTIMFRWPPLPSPADIEVSHPFDSTKNSGDDDVALFYIRDAATKGQGAIFQFNEATGTKRSLTPAAWNNIRAVNPRVIVNDISAARLNAIPGK